MPLALHPGDLTVQLAARLRVEPGRRLVQEHELGIVDEGEGERQALPLSARERLERRVGLLEEREALQEGRRLRFPLIERAKEGQRLARRDLVLESSRLQRRADLFFHLARPLPGIEAADLDRASIWLTQPDDAFDSRRLARPVGSDEPEDLAIADLEAHAARRFDAAVALFEIADGDFRGC